MTRSAIRGGALGLLCAVAAAPLALAQAMPQDPAGMPPPAAALPGEPGVVASQPVANPPDSRPDTKADTGYTGQAYGAAFRDIDARIAALTPRVSGKSASALRAVKSEELIRRKRNGGELRDWDRELLNKRLDAVDAMVGPG